MRLISAISLIAMVVGVPLHCSTEVRAASTYYYETSWTFDVRGDSDVEVICLTTIHPSWGTWTESGMNFKRQIENFQAYDEITGASLRVEVKKSGSWANYTVYFSQAQGDGYSFRVHFRVIGLVKATSSGLSLSWGWGGTSKPLPQDV